MDQQRRKVRKGTRSCAECRRKKLKCSWSNDDDASACRRCEERDLTCTPQIFSHPSSSSYNRKNSTARGRVAQLENQILELSRTVNSLSSRIGDPILAASYSKVSPVSLDQACDSTGSHAEDDEGDEDDDDAYSLEDYDDDVAFDHSGRPSYLDALFDNEIFHAADHEAGLTATAKQTRTKQNATNTLRSLIPCREDVEIIAERARSWLDVVYKFVTFSSVVQSSVDILSLYDTVSRGDVEPSTLVIWLLTLAITTESNQDLQVALPSSISPTPARDYARIVSKAIEQSYTCRDNLVSCNEGIESLLLLSQCHITRGNESKSFINLRRAVTISELMGLPSASSDAETFLWGRVCTAERIQSIVFSFPCVTKQYTNHSPRPAVNYEGTGNCLLSQISSIGIRLDDIHDSASHPIPIEELRRQTCAIQADLDAVASVVATHWEGDLSQMAPFFRLIKDFYTFVSMRAQIPLLIRRDGQGRVACISACYTLACNYLQLGKYSKKVFSVHRILDLQVYTAVVILMLDEHGAFTADEDRTGQSILHPEKFRRLSVGDLVSEVIEVLEHNFASPGRSTFSTVIKGIRALKSLLENQNGGLDATSDQQEGITLNVPLMGKLRVKARDKRPDPNLPTHATFQEQPILPNMGVGLANYHATGDFLGGFADASGQFPLSWSVEQNDQLYFTPPDAAFRDPNFSGWPES